MYLFIVNPHAGNGRGLRVFTKLKKSKLYQSMSRKVYLTEYPGHAEEIAKTLDESTDIHTIIVIGGDGTIHEVLNGLDQVNIRIAFIPGGSGNDFARGAAMHGKPLDILNEIIHGHTDCPYWVGSLSIDQTIRKYVNSVGFGFDAQIADTVNKSWYKQLFNRIGLGKLTYIIALIQVLIHFKPMNIDIGIENKRRSLQNCWMVTTCNHPYYGGGMKIIPEAEVQSKAVPLLIIHNISKWKVLVLFLTVFWGGHVRFKEVEILKTTGFHIFSKDEIYLQVDGQSYTCRSSQVNKHPDVVKITGTKRCQTI